MLAFSDIKKSCVNTSKKLCSLIFSWCCAKKNTQCLQLPAVSVIVWPVEAEPECSLETAIVLPTLMKLQGNWCVAATAMMRNLQELSKPLHMLCDFTVDLKNL